MTDQKRHSLAISEALAGQRLDKALPTLLAEMGESLSRARVQALIKEGQLFYNSAVVADGKIEAKLGQVYELVVPASVPLEHIAPQDIPLDIIYEDDDVIVLNKPAGLVVHPAAGNHDGTLVNALLFHRGSSLSGIGGVQRPGIVHRLDKETSGLMVVAKNDRAHHALTHQFADRSLSRTYYAVVWGIPMPRAGQIDAPIDRSPYDRQKMAVVDTGRAAVTLYTVEKLLAGGALALVKCNLLTGRTHQIRVHMAHIGHSLVGDPLYGGNQRRKIRISDEAKTAIKDFTRQALHASALKFIHPTTGQEVQFSIPMAEDMASLISVLERSVIV